MAAAHSGESWSSGETLPSCCARNSTAASRSVRTSRSRGRRGLRQARLWSAAWSQVICWSVRTSFRGLRVKWWGAARRRACGPSAPRARGRHCGRIRLRGRRRGRFVRVNGPRLRRRVYAGKRRVHDHRTSRPEPRCEDRPARRTGQLTRPQLAFHAYDIGVDDEHSAPPPHAHRVVVHEARSDCPPRSILMSTASVANPRLRAHTESRPTLQDDGCPVCRDVRLHLAPPASQPKDLSLGSAAVRAGAAARRVP
jgi:hypothetical protein